jgi:hypothetical protein
MWEGDVCPTAPKRESESRDPDTPPASRVMFETLNRVAQAKGRAGERRLRVVELATQTRRPGTATGSALGGQSHAQLAGDRLDVGSTL